MRTAVRMKWLTMREHGQEHQSQPRYLHLVFQHICKGVGWEIHSGRQSSWRRKELQQLGEQLSCMTHLSQSWAAEDEQHRALTETNIATCKETCSSSDQVSRLPHLLLNGQLYLDPWAPKNLEFLCSMGHQLWHRPQVDVLSGAAGSDCQKCKKQPQAQSLRHPCKVPQSFLGKSEGKTVVCHCLFLECAMMEKRSRKEQCTNLQAQDKDERRGGIWGAPSTTTHCARSTWGEGW